jgi:hypothetical protein
VDRDSFYYLYVNANSIAELALQQLAEQLLALPQPSSSSPMSPEELNTRVAASFEGIDLAALEGVNYDLSDLASANELDPQASVEAPQPVERSAEAEAERESAIERYLGRAYAHEEMLRERIDQYYQRTDLPALEAAFAQLPAQLAPLTRLLSPREMSRWLDLYERGNEALDDVVVQLRQLDMSAGEAAG